MNKTQAHFRQGSRNQRKKAPEKRRRVHWVFDDVGDKCCERFIKPRICSEPTPWQILRDSLRPRSITCLKRDSAKQNGWNRRRQRINPAMVDRSKWKAED